MEFQNILYEKPEAAIARIWLNRPDTRNAQDTKMLYEINDAFNLAVNDEEVKVIILAAKGPHFSAGHHLKESPEAMLDASRQYPLVGSWRSSDNDGAEAMYSREKEIYEGFCRRWRNLAKPTIASVQGKAIAGGLMLIWPCDFVIATESTTFQDNTLYMGIPGVEYFVHVWELGIRKAKEFLLGGQPLSAREAQQAGMINRIVPDDELEEATLAFARSIADKPAFALKLAKDTINAAFDAQGMEVVQRAAFNAHHLAHNHYRLKDGMPLDAGFVANFMNKSKL